MLAVRAVLVPLVPLVLLALLALLVLLVVGPAALGSRTSAQHDRVSGAPRTASVTGRGAQL